MDVYITRAHVAPPVQGERHIKLQLPDAFPVGNATVEVRFPDALPSSTLILTIPRPQAPALPEAACWPVADLGFMHPPLWRERALVEHDETLLQPVAYGLLLNDQGHAWCYQRAGGDARVDGRLSCGVGGHVDAQDAQPLAALGNPGTANPDTANAPVPVPAFNPLATLRTAWLRELSEELHAGPVHLARVRLHGLVYESHTAIGRVHLGVVFVAQWCGPTLPQPPVGEALNPIGFVPLAHIATDTRFEHWSRLVAQHLLATSQGCTA